MMGEAEDFNKLVSTLINAGYEVSGVIHTPDKNILFEQKKNVKRT